MMVPQKIWTKSKLLFQVAYTQYNGLMTIPWNQQECEWTFIFIAQNYDNIPPYKQDMSNYSSAIIFYQIS